ncbi:MarR family winged helix-turn-helix transcriptional regulator [Polycyclovorans algicola]|uniref:MarR family winged helix-turn-helix transcriptional regulator n=1 Tax=Polycyclovorans algicola TaxID=616992 RepID=UPI000693CEF5|nr:MarR family transcriptional regulator [Polycyclovorans algicola]
MNKPLPPPELLTVTRALRRLTQALDSQSKQLETLSGMTASQWLCLQALAQSARPLSARELADWVSLTPGTISPVLDRLEIKGWVQRTRSVEDRRRIDLEITDTGRSQWQSAPGVLPTQGVAQFAALGRERRKALAQSLEDLTALLAPIKETTRT